MMPMQPIFDDIKTKLKTDDVRLPTVAEIDSAALSHGHAQSPDRSRVTAGDTGKVSSRSQPTVTAGYTGKVSSRSQPTPVHGLGRQGLTLTYSLA